MYLFASIEGIVQFITVLFIFVFVLAITYFTTRLIGNYQKNTMQSGNINVLETLRISSTKYIQIIRIGDKCFAIAVSKDNITLLGEVDKESLTDNNSGTSKDSFKDILNRFKVKNKDEHDV